MKCQSLFSGKKIRTHKKISLICRLLCVVFDLEFYGQVNMSIYLTTLFLGRLSPLSGSPVLVHILPPEIDNCPS